MFLDEITSLDTVLEVNQSENEAKRLEGKWRRRKGLPSSKASISKLSETIIINRPGVWLAGLFAPPLSVIALWLHTGGIGHNNLVSSGLQPGTLESQSFIPGFGYVTVDQGPPGETVRPYISSLHVHYFSATCQWLHSQYPSWSCWAQKQQASSSQSEKLVDFARRLGWDRFEEEKHSFHTFFWVDKVPRFSPETRISRHTTPRNEESNLTSCN